AGALPLNYPNALDLRRGKTGSGIWLHGTPSAQFSRAPLATDGCVAIANPDLERILSTVEPRSTPVVIAKQLEWVGPQGVLGERIAFNQTLDAWRNAKSGGDLAQLMGFYTYDFQSFRNQSITEWRTTLQDDVNSLRGRSLVLKDKSALHWRDSADTMVVTFAEVPAGAKVGPVKRQYWRRQGQRWQIFFEGVIG
ncbi:MAG: L,D-transpeptidase family protein, partial [Giesbergeria sp.]